MKNSHLLPLKNRAIGRLRFSLRGLLHVGSGGKDVRRELLKVIGESLTPDGKKKPKEWIVLPSSSVKGAIRSMAEWVSRSVGSVSVPGCFKVADGGLKVEENREDEAFQWLLEQSELYNTLVSLGFGDEFDNYRVQEQTVRDDLKRLWSTEKELLMRMAESYATTLHPLYRLFGGRSVAAKVRFLDTFLDSLPMDKTGIAMDKKSGKVLEKHLYVLESLAPQSFDVWFIADNLLPGGEDSKLFALTLENIRSTGLWIGGRKSTGMGRLELEGCEVWVVETEKDENGDILVNPFQDSAKKDLTAFLKYLTAD